MALTSSTLPPTPAAPIGEATVVLYALHDIEAKQGREMVIRHKRGHAQELPTAIAREVVRNQPDDYGFDPPSGVEAVTALSPAAVDASAVDGMISQLLGSPEGLARLRAALGSPGVIQGEEARAAGVAPLSAAAGSAVQGLGGTTIPTANASDTATAAPAEPFILTSLPGVNEKVARTLEDNRLGTLEALRGADQETLASLPGIGNKLAERIVDHIATQHLSDRRHVDRNLVIPKEG